MACGVVCCVCVCACARVVCVGCVCTCGVVCGVGGGVCTCVVVARVWCVVKLGTLSLLLSLFPSPSLSHSFSLSSFFLSSFFSSHRQQISKRLNVTWHTAAANKVSTKSAFEISSRHGLWLRR